jgi:zinc protease
MTVIATRPNAGPPRTYRFPEFERRTLGNGLRLIVAPMHALPVVTVTAVVDAGAIAEPTNSYGVAHLTAHLLLEGAAGYDGEALTEALERSGTAIDADVDWDATTLTMTALSSALPSAFAHFANVLTSPTFPEAPLERLKGERIAEILQVEAEPRELANEQFGRFLYRDGSRYQVAVGGGKESVTALTREDVVTFYTRRYTPKSVTLIFAGDITVEAAEQLAQEAFDAWSGVTPAEVLVNDAAARTSRAVHIVHRPDAPQSELRVGHVGVPRHHPDYFPITVMNAILGGLFGSRVNLNLREAHGYTYGAFSSFDWRHGSGPFVVSTAVASNVTAPSIQEILLEIDRMRRDAVTESELSLATNYLDGVFPIRFETSSAVAAALEQLVVFGLPDDWYDVYRTNIRAVSSADVLAAAQAYLHPEQLQFVIVGDAAAIRDPLEALELGPVGVHDE